MHLRRALGPQGPKDTYAFRHGSFLATTERFGVASDYVGWKPEFIEHFCEYNNAVIERKLCWIVAGRSAARLVGAWSV